MIPGGAGPAGEAAAAALAPDLVAIITHLDSGTSDSGPAGREYGPAAVVRVRLSGSPADVEMVVAELARHFQVAGRSRPRPNRYEPGQRVYLTLCPRQAGPEPGA